ncbi:MAG: cobalt ECF transporter T component CbiQ [Candidatus Marinimicrobia bacterium]|nr:cobalt ECF transporter T component CbiQ [Candidatus Neomarinimicrobiota bacterium]MCF7829982.1 cobalt ECF transporter T component CbiQ [Candidatus Neomarinimicrobiota bacterium]MCF7881864.1 cobalt ECF transporter T component CbiQ [Candidatus Neomarinimicrobiota bacterium]
MQHAYFDKYSNRSSPVHNLGIRRKLVLFLGLLIYFGVVPVTWSVFIVNLSALFALFYLAKIPARFILRRAVVILPFLLFIIVIIPLVQEQSWAVARNTFARAICSVLALILFVSTTKFPRLLRVLEKMKVPAVIVQVLAFIYRYFFVLIDELQRMKLAVRARAPKRRKSLVYLAFSNLLGMLIVRSYERSERIYQAMRLRGYDGDGEDL